MNKYRLNAQDCLLVIIDLQERLMVAMKDRERVARNANMLLTAADLFDIPVIVTEQYPKGLGPTIAELQPNMKSPTMIEKTQFSACTEDFTRLVADSGRKTILISGSETHVCVFQTSRDLLETGYNVHLVRDAVCSRFDENYENGLKLMKGCGAVITNTETVLFDLLKEAGGPAFKTISNLVK